MLFGHEKGQWPFPFPIGDEVLERANPPGGLWVYQGLTDCFSQRCAEHVGRELRCQYGLEPLPHPFPIGFPAHPALTAR